MRGSARLARRRGRRRQQADGRAGGLEQESHHPGPGMCGQGRRQLALAGPGDQGRLHAAEGRGRPAVRGREPLRAVVRHQRPRPLQGQCRAGDQNVSISQLQCARAQRACQLLGRLYRKTRWFGGTACPPGAKGARLRTVCAAHCGRRHLCERPTVALR